MNDSQRNIPSPESVSGLRVGLLGGSFNPAHEGHLHISHEALNRLELDQVWWLVTPGNPLKSSAELASIESRVSGARAIAAKTEFKVMDLEGPLGLRYTVDTLDYLLEEFPKTHFIWLMGGDCLETLHTWKNWEKIMTLTPLGIFKRPGYEARVLNSKAAIKFKKFRVYDNKFKTLVVTDPPAWGYIGGKGKDISATELRKTVAK